VFNHLKANAVGVVIHYPIPLHLQKAYAELKYKKGDFPVSEKVAQEIISLPMYPYMKEKDIKFVVKLIKEAVV
jgi:dTDP-4-amino-4,6-dideoxygalactose transaminase